MRLPGGLDSHPLADVFPMMEGDELRRLVESMKTRGFDPAEPVVCLLEKVKPEKARKGASTKLRRLVLDGRNRLVAAERAGVKPKFSDHELRADGSAAGLGDPTKFVVARNIARRHLTESQRAVIANRLATLAQGQKQTGNPAGLPAPTQAQAAKQLNVSERLVRDARVVEESAIAPVRKAVEQGRLTVSAGAALARKPEKVQKAVAKRVDLEAKKEVRPGLISTYVKQETRKEQAAELAAKPVPLIEGPWPVIAMDFPWKYETRHDDPSQRGQVGYAEMTIEEGCKLPVLDLIDRKAGCAMWFWIPDVFLIDAAHIRLFDAWGGWKKPGGWRPRSLVAWDKVNPGPGNTLFNVTEHLILATIGDPPITVKNETNLIREKKREHSRKPEAFGDLVDAVTKGAVLEMFSRSPRPGWTQWGNETGKFAADPQLRMRA